MADQQNTFERVILSEEEKRTPKAVAVRLLELVRPAVRDSGVVVMARQRKLTDEAIARILCLEHATVGNISSALHLAAARFTHTEAGEFIEVVAASEREDRKRVERAFDAMSAPSEDHPGKVLGPKAYEYCGYICWLCLEASQAAFALLVYVDFVLAHEACTVLVPALRERVGTPDEVTDYFSMYEERPDDILNWALGILEDGVRNGDDLQRAADLIVMMRHYMSSFWSTPTEVF